jgi:hypothetical protein
VVPASHQIPPSAAPKSEAITKRLEIWPSVNDVKNKRSMMKLVIMWIARARATSKAFQPQVALMNPRKRKFRSPRSTPGWLSRRARITQPSGEMRFLSMVFLTKTTRELFFRRVPKMPSHLIVSKSRLSTTLQQNWGSKYWIRAKIPLLGWPLRKQTEGEYQLLKCKMVCTLFRRRSL